MFIPDPGSWFLPIPDPGSRIPDPKSQNRNKREWWKKNFCHTFFCCHKFHKIVDYFIFEMLKKRIWASFQRIIELFTQKIVTKLSKIWVWDPGSGKNLSLIQGSKRHRIPDPDPQHWLKLCFWPDSEPTQLLYHPNKNLGGEGTLRQLNTCRKVPL